MHGFWGVFWLAVILKIPIAALLGLVWYAVRQPPVPEVEQDDSGGSRRGPHPPNRPPHPPRRGPHAEPPPAAPERARSELRAYSSGSWRCLAGVSFEQPTCTTAPPRRRSESSVAETPRPQTRQTGRPPRGEEIAVRMFSRRGDIGLQVRLSAEAPRSVTRA